MGFILASGQMRRKSRMTERLSQSLFPKIGPDQDFFDVTLLCSLKGNPTNRILILVSSSSTGSYHSFSGRIVISVAWSMTLYRYVSLRPLVSMPLSQNHLCLQHSKVSIALRLDQGSGRASNPAANKHFNKANIRWRIKSAGSQR